MPRVSYKYHFTEEDKAIAESNGIAISTVYARLRQGWDKGRAISEPPKKLKLSQMSRNEWGEIQSDRRRGKGRTIYLPEDLDEKLDRAIAISGKSQSAYIAELVERCLK
jgi:hypothetical protein